MFAMNATPQPSGDRNVFRRYLDWLLSQTQGQSTQAVANIMGAPLANLAINSQPLNIPQTAVEQPRTTANVSAEDLLGTSAQAPGSYRLPDWARIAPGSFSGVSGPQLTPQPVPSGMDRNALLGYLQNYLNIGGYFPAGVYPREYFNEIADEFDAAMKTIATKQKDAEWNPIETEYLNAIAVNPDDKDAQRMLDYFDQIKKGKTPEGIINDNWDLTVDEQEKIKDFGSYLKTQIDARGDLAAQEIYVSEAFGLPDPSATWDINPEIAAQLWTRQKDGLTERQAQERELRAAQEALPYYTPRSANQIREDLMRQYIAEARANPKEKSGEVLSAKKAVAEEARRKVMESSVDKFRPNIDRIEAAGQRVMNKIGSRSAEKKLNERTANIDAEIEKQIRIEGGKAMRGEKIQGGAEYQRVKDAERRVAQAKSFEDELAMQIAEKLTSMYGRPYEAALEEAKRYVTSRGKTYNYPGGPTGGYP